MALSLATASTVPSLHSIVRVAKDGTTYLVSSRSNSSYPVRVSTNQKEHQKQHQNPPTPTGNRLRANPPNGSSSLVHPAWFVLLIFPGCLPRLLLLLCCLLTLSPLRPVLSSLPHFPPISLLPSPSLFPLPPLPSTQSQGRLSISFPPPPPTFSNLPSTGFPPSFSKDFVGGRDYLTRKQHAQPSG
ncbi:uncharacterized protein BO80DRAFT_134210 [Aspergillus ibericus CBS 121593]|uniref:Uncharacterized protein n=1 Tax=Aspergillus ibericus CBS 121593 TaxID=1448316 RepID=A0A395HGI1_9EURO|nr:hypothetical protein BO80DRAFT_134210 [Aspergillus ibericus CBS 121593]RAL05324.1 hypothetical protein BO80DRAFT_134210 [Aspergillus ibericus CBS 121593]